MDYAFITLGLLLLFVGGEALVRSSVVISKRLGISTILIGVVVVGFGTSTPELLVSIKASLAGQPDIAIGNVVGSNIANILLILGLAAIITPVICINKAVRRDAFAVVAASLILYILAYLQLVSQFFGGMMFVTLITYVIYCYKSEQKYDRSVSVTSSDKLGVDESYKCESQECKKKIGIIIAILISILGIVMLLFGADFLVHGASNVARRFGISEAVIGLSLVAVGTSLPELVTAVSCAFKKNSDLIIGNILGSNLFNILGILGIAAIIKPIPVAETMVDFDIPINLIIAIVSLLIIILFKKIGRLIGFLFLVAYLTYIVWIYINGAVIV